MPTPDRFAFPLALLLATVAPMRLSAQPAAATPDSLAAAAARQLAVGEQWFTAECLACHAIGNLQNPDFRLAWRGKSAYELFERIRSTMPSGKPGSLTQGTYASIVAYLMKLNGMPMGARRVSSDSTALASIRLTFPAASPAASSR
jgi:S-disulfanyl-L-cysteine oxidoreductase SoxD